MLSSAASDVHPLLYYLAAKLFLDAVRLFVTPSPETCVVLLRLFSVLPMCVLSLLGYTRVRRYMGERCGLLFTLFVGFAPSTYYLGLQIRMYSWAALWVFCAFLFAWRLAAEQRQGSGAKSRFLWAGLAAFSLLAAYTHYYALAAAVFIQLGLLIFLLHTQRGSKASALVPWFLTVLGQLLLYLPGFFLFYRQASAVSDGYWIQIQYPDILEEIASFFVEGALPRSLALPAGTLLLTAIFFLLVLRLPRESTPFRAAIFLCLLPPVGVCAAGLGISLIRPLFIPRYLFPMSGLFWLLPALLLSSLRRPWSATVMAVLLLSLGLKNTAVRHAAMTSPENDGWKAAIASQRQEGDAFFFSDMNVGCQPAVFFPSAPLYFQNHFHWSNKNGLMGFSSMTFVEDGGQLDALLPSGNRLWIIDSQNSDLAAALPDSFSCLHPKSSYFHPYSGQWITLSLWLKT